MVDKSYTNINPVIWASIRVGRSWKQLWWRKSRLNWRDFCISLTYPARGDVMTRQYQTEVEELTDEWIAGNPEDYEYIVNKHTKNLAAMIIGKLISIFIIMVLIFRVSTLSLVLYAPSAIIYVLYKYYTNDEHLKAREEVRGYILEEYPDIKHGYDQEILSKGIGARVPDWFIQAFLLMFLGMIILGIIVSALQ